MMYEHRIVTIVISMRALKDTQFSELGPQENKLRSLQSTPCKMALEGHPSSRGSSSLNPAALSLPSVQDLVRVSSLTLV